MERTLPDSRLDSTLSRRNRPATATSLEIPPRGCTRPTPLINAALEKVTLVEAIAGSAAPHVRPRRSAREPILKLGQLMEIGGWSCVYLGHNMRGRFTKIVDQTVQIFISFLRAI